MSITYIIARNEFDAIFIWDSPQTIFLVFLIIINIIIIGNEDIFRIICINYEAHIRFLCQSVLSKTLMLKNLKRKNVLS